MKHQFKPVGTDSFKCLRCDLVCDATDWPFLDTDENNCIVVVTRRQRIIHFVGWRLDRILHWLDDKTQTPFMQWSNQIHSWMEENHACCTRHGYDKDKDGST